MKIHTAYFDELKWETERYYKLGDNHTREFDVWIPKRLCEIRKLGHGYEIRIPEWFARENKIL